MAARIAALGRSTTGVLAPAGAFLGMSAQALALRLIAPADAPTYATNYTHTYIAWMRAGRGPCSWRCRHGEASGRRSTIAWDALRRAAPERFPTPIEAGGPRDERARRRQIGGSFEPGTPCGGPGVPRP